MKVVWVAGMLVTTHGAHVQATQGQERIDEARCNSAP